MRRAASLTMATLLGVAAGAAQAAPAANACTAVLETPVTGDKLVFTRCDRAKCEAQILTAVGKDGVPAEASQLANPKVLDAHDCDDAGVLCIGPRGLPLIPAKVPAELRPGDKLTIKVIGCDKLREKVEHELEAKKIATADRLFKVVPEASTDGAPLASLAAGTCEEPRICQDAADMAVLKELSITVPHDDGLRRLDIEYASDTSKATYASALTDAKHTISIPILQGLYYLDLGILVPFVVEGRRRVRAQEVPGSGTQTLLIDHDMAPPAPAVMLDIFPGGRRAGIFHSFAERRRCDDTDGSYSRCKSSNHARNAANSLGLQLGLDLDFTDLADAFFLGGLFEPVTGLSFNAGISVRKGEFLKPGHREGQLVSAPANLEADERHMVRPYFGVTLSLDIIRAIAVFGRNARAEQGGGK